MRPKMKDLIWGMEGNEIYVLANEWWNHNKNTNNNVYYTLCASYALLAIVALVQIVRIQRRVPEYGWTTQKAFHLMNFIVNGLRAILFGFYKKVFQIRPLAVEIMLLDLPGLLFFSTYTLLVLFWAEIYHQARSLPTDRLRPGYYFVNCIVYLVQIIIWICMWINNSHSALRAAKLLFSIISFGAAFGFLVYGGRLRSNDFPMVSNIKRLRANINMYWVHNICRLFLMLKRFPIESSGRQKKIYEVGIITTICCTCFIIRCIVVAISAFDEDIDVDVIDHPFGNLLYYMVVEIIPSALVLFVLRKLPSRRVSDHYQAIQ